MGEDRSGQRFGPYELGAELGRGGMGRVFRARHVALERDVAIKLLAPHLSADPFYVDRFLKEARAAARINHPNIVQIYDFGQQGEEFYLAMELVEGRSLAQLLKNWGRFSEANAVAVGRQVLSALAVAHEAGIIHRDVKPDNVVLGHKAVVKLVDLGLAKRMDAGHPSATSTGLAAGTPHYMSPEQIEALSDIDGRADLYALGVTLYQLATGEPPFHGSSGAVIMSKHLHAARPDPRTLVPELSQAFATFVLRMMACDRRDRFPNARDADAALAAASRAEAPAAPALERPSRPMPPPLTAPPPAREEAGPVEGFSPSALVRVEDELARAIGPMARVLVRRKAAEAGDLAELVSALAGDVPEEAARRRFVDALARPAPIGSGRASSPSAPSGSSAASGVAPSLHPDLLAGLERALAAEIGPLARVLVKRHGKRARGFDALVAALAAEVPEGPGRARFAAAVRSLSA